MTEGRGREIGEFGIRNSEGGIRKAEKIVLGSVHRAWYIGHKHKASGTDGSNSKPLARKGFNEINDPDELNLLNQPQNTQGK